MLLWVQARHVVFKPCPDPSGYRLSNYTYTVLAMSVPPGKSLGCQSLTFVVIVHLAEASEGLVVTVEFRQDNGGVKVAFRYVTPILPKGDQREGRGRGPRVWAKQSLSLYVECFLWGTEHVGRSLF